MSPTSIAWFEIRNVDGTHGSLHSRTKIFRCNSVIILGSCFRAAPKNSSLAKTNRSDKKKNKFLIGFELLLGVVKFFTINYPAARNIILFLVSSPLLIWSHTAITNLIYLRRKIPRRWNKQKRFPVSFEGKQYRARLSGRISQFLQLAPPAAPQTHG